MEAETDLDFKLMRYSHGLELLIIHISRDVVDSAGTATAATTIYPWKQQIF